jgi:DNA-binding PadR family transcriptional regulator
MFFLGKKLQAKGLKLSPLEFMILLKIYEGDKIGISGYDLMSELTITFAGMWSAKSGTIYPLLNRMKERELIIAQDVKSELGPAKKVFKLTELSKTIIEELILDNFEPELKFFSNYLDFVSRMIMKLSERKSIGPINLEQVKTALELFSTHVNEIDFNLNDFMSVNKVNCNGCGTEVDRLLVKFCPKCGEIVN